MSDEPGDRPRVSAFDRAARLLALRSHFRAELKRKLIQKGHEPDETDEALARLERLGYLDDAALARAEVERLRRSRRLGRTAILAALARRGAPEPALEAALAGIEPDDELRLAVETASRWLARHRPEAAGLARHLDRKGYARRVIFRVLNDLLPGTETPPEAD